MRETVAQAVIGLGHGLRQQSASAERTSAPHLAFVDRRPNLPGRAHADGADDDVLRAVAVTSDNRAAPRIWCVAEWLRDAALAAET